MSLFFRPVWVGLFLLPGIAANALSPDRVYRLQDIREKTLSWAFRAEDGGLATDPSNEQGDMVQRSGVLCLFGMRERCEDVRSAQGPDGRFWRARQYIDRAPIDAFSRDHFNGVMAYYLATRDRDSAERYLAYLNAHGEKLCDRASDDRCDMMVDTWGLMGRVWKANGWRPGRADLRKMRHGMRLDGVGVVVGAFSPLGFESVLPAWASLVRWKALGRRSPAVRLAMKIAAHRQPYNALVRFAKEGPTDRVADLAIAACNGERGRGPYDFIWNRRMFVENGQLYIESGMQNKARVQDASDGWDCILIAQLLLNELT